MPQVDQRQATGFEPYTFPVSHKEINVRYWKKQELEAKGLSTYRFCSRCKALAVRDGGRDGMGWRHGDGNGGPRLVDGEQKDDWVRKMPAGGNVPQSWIACSLCKVRLCSTCFRMELADGKPHPDAWDHKAKSLRARCVVAH